MKALFVKASSSAALMLIFLAMFLPTAYIPIKAALLIIMTAGVIVSGFLGYMVWNKETVFACFLLALVGLLNSLHGQVRGNLGAVPMLTVMVIWPLVYCAASALLNNKKSFYWVARVLFLSLTAIVIYMLLFLGYKAGVVPAWAYIELDMGQDISDLFVEFSLYNVTSLTFLIPFAGTYVYLINPESFKAKILVFISLAICSVIVVLSGRRALQILMLISPLITIFTILILQRKVKLFKLVEVVSYWMPKVILMAALVIVIATIFISEFTESVASNFIYSYDILDNDKESERTDQFYSLISGWINSSILFGAGNGAFTEVIRSTEMPWAYDFCLFVIFNRRCWRSFLFWMVWMGPDTFETSIDNEA